MTDCRCGCGMNITLVLRLCVGDKLIIMLLRTIFAGITSVSRLDPISEDPVCNWVVRANLPSISDGSLPLTSILSLYFGILAMLDLRELVQIFDGGCWVASDIFLYQLLHINKRCTETGSKVLVSRAITLWTNRMCTAIETSVVSETQTSALTGEGLVIKNLLGYIWTTWEDQVDVIRQNARSAFENTIQIHLLSVKSDPRSDTFIEQVTETLLEVSWSNKGKYGCLRSVVGHIGTTRLLEINSGIANEVLQQVQDQSLACYASDLYEKLFKSHSADLPDGCHGDTIQTSQCETKWLTMWVDPVIHALCRTNKKLKTHIIEYVLPKILKVKKTTLPYMIQKLSVSSSQTNNQVGALVMCLRRARALGLLQARRELSGGGDSTLWYGMVKVDVLKYALTCSDEQVQMDAFALLCVNSKTVEPVTELEFGLLRYFIPPNLNNQSPSFRQDLLSYLQKLLLRLKESSGALVRLTLTKKKTLESERAAVSARMYQNFLEWFQGHMFRCLYPGSAFAHKTTCLTGLQMMADCFNGRTNKMTGSSSGIYSFVSHVDNSCIQTLLECLTDTFEENKLIASKILSVCISQGIGIQGREQVEALYQASIVLSTSTRPHDCTTAAYLFRFVLLQPSFVEVMKKHQLDLKILTANQEIDQIVLTNGNHVMEKCPTLMLLTLLLVLLKDQTAVATKSLTLAAANRPMYPTLHCIRHILTGVNLRSVTVEMEVMWRSFIDHLIQTCLELAKVVSPVVQDSSPEGNVPTEAIAGPSLDIDSALQSDNEQKLRDETEASQQTVMLMPEFLVVCCWRSIKEVSLVLGQLCLSTPLVDPSRPDTGLLSINQVLSLGDYFTTQLLESKHRGAFELAYAGFVKMCEMLWRNPLVQLHQLPSYWLNHVISDIIADDPNSRLCATRRSAGVPFYVQALVTSEPPSTGRTCFNDAITKLLSLSFGTKEEITSTSNAQVHSLNILRALFRDTRLGEDVVPYIPQGLKSAILGFKSQNWAVRNSSTLLLSALMTRIFGVKRSKDGDALSKKNCQTGRAFFHRYQSLYQFLLNELDEATCNIESSERLQLHPSLYPVLMVLGRLFSSSLEGIDTNLNLTAFIPFVIKCASSPVYKTRMMAARALQPLVMKDQLTSLLVQLLAMLPTLSATQIRHSCIHGILLQIKHLLVVPCLGQMAQSDVTQIVLPRWMDSLWLATRVNKCLATRKIALEVTDCLLSCVDTTSAQPDIASNCLCKNLVAILETELWDTVSYSRHVPMAVEFEITLSQLCLKYISSNTSSKDTSSDRSEKVILHLLSSSIYEVRLSVLEVLATYFVKISKTWKKTDDDMKSGQGGNETGTLLSEVSGLNFCGIKNSENLYQHLLSMVLTWEWHHLCLTKVLQVARLHPVSDNITTILKTQSAMKEVFKTVVNKIHQEPRDEVKSSMIQFSGILIPAVYSYLAQEKDADLHQCLWEWCTILMENSATKQSADLQRSCALTIRQNACILLLDSHKTLGSLTFKFWDIVISLLQEDDLEVKDIAASILPALNQTYEFWDLQPSLTLQTLLSRMIDIHGERDPVGCIRTLVAWMKGDTKVDTNQDERLFDKGEMNTYREDVIFVHLVAEQLTRLLMVGMELSKREGEKNGLLELKKCEEKFEPKESGILDQATLKIYTEDKAGKGKSFRILNFSENQSLDLCYILNAEVQDIFCDLLQNFCDKIYKENRFSYMSPFLETVFYQCTVDTIFRASSSLKCLENVPKGDKLNDLFQKLVIGIREKFCSGLQCNFLLSQSLVK